MEEAIGNTFLLAMMVVFVVLPNVVANAWFSVWPLMADTNFMRLFRCVFVKHVGMHLGTV